MRKHLWLDVGIVAWMIGGLLCAAAPAAHADARPNFLLMIADDLTWSDLGYEGHREVQTPHLDKLCGESIHLRALGRQNPLDEFHRLAVDGFAHLAADAIEASQQTFDTANVLESEPGLDLSKLARPTSTWTYMVHDNPLRDDALSALSLPGVFR